MWTALLHVKKCETRIKSYVDGGQTAIIKRRGNRVTKGVEWTSRLSANQQNSRGKNKAIYDFNNGNDASKREERSNKIYHSEAFCESSVLHASNDLKCIKED